MTTPRIHTLANGVRVVCDPIGGPESLALSIVIDGGSRWESEATAGWAHLLEHMVFKGAGERSSREIVEAIEGQGGQINAATGQERTSFQVRCLTGGLPLGMAVLTDLVRRPTLDSADLEKEKGVVGQEIAEAADTPDDRVFELAQSRAYAGHPLGRPILGEVESLAPATRGALSAFHQGLYAADRIVVSAAGGVDEDQLLALTEAAFGDARAPAKALSRPEQAAFAGGHASETRKLEQAHLVLMLPGLSRHDPDYFAQSLFTEILGGGMSSRLFQQVREARGLAYAIDAYNESYEDVGAVGVYAGTGAADAAPAARLTAEEIKKLISKVEDGELARAKAQMKGSLFMRRESPLARAEANANNIHSFGRLFPAQELADKIDAVGAVDIRRVGERLTAAGRSASAVLGPKRAAGAGAAFAEALAAG
jgi:predicted Zn-dependent peptidase